MHAGDALWILYGINSLLERRATRQGTILLLGNARAALDRISLEMCVPAPSKEALQQLIENLQAEIGEERAPPSSKSESFGDNVANASKMLDEMLASGLFDWANILNSYQEQLESDDPFFTNRQWRAMVNVAQRGKTADDESWWDEFEAEHPELAAYAIERTMRAE